MFARDIKLFHVLDHWDLPFSQLLSSVRIFNCASPLNLVQDTRSLLLSRRSHHSSDHIIWEGDIALSDLNRCAIAIKAHLIKVLV